jgi:pimeloyl-ACP methyl ester carboxylesterase
MPDVGLSLQMLNDTSPVSPMFSTNDRRSDGTDAPCNHLAPTPTAMARLMQLLGNGRTLSSPAPSECVASIAPNTSKCLFPTGKSYHAGIGLVLLLVVPCLALGQEASDEIEFARQLPLAAKQHVYLFFLNGIDPLEFGNLSGLRDFCRDLGFARSWYGQFYHRWYFQRVIEEIRERDPEARLVIIGFSAGALAARDLAQALNRENIPVELLVYLGGATLTNAPRNRPENVRRLIHIRANDPVFRGWAIEGADNVKCQDVWHFGTPMHAETRRRIAAALAEIAGQVPVEQPPASIWRPAHKNAPGISEGQVPSAAAHPSSASQSQAHPQQANVSAANRAGDNESRATAVFSPAHLSRPEPSQSVSQVSAPPAGVTQKPAQPGTVIADTSEAWGFLRATRQLRPVPPPDYSGLPYRPLRGEP